MMQEAETIYSEVPASVSGWIASLRLEQTIGNRDVAAGRRPVIHPADGEVIAECPEAQVSDVDAAVDAARAAYPGWAALSWGARRERLEAFADALHRNRKALAFIIAAETGRPLRRAWSEVFFSVDFVRTIAAQELPETVYDRAGLRARLVHRPLGVVGAIAPWNAPVILAVAKIANALLAGDTLVLRPAPQTPLSALFMGQLAREIFPAGVYNTITGDAAVGAAMASHPGIAKISFTGSTGTGRLIAAAAAPTLKKLTLELGGNDAAIVLDDADPADVAACAYAISLQNAGQFCAAIKRLYVHESLYSAVRDRLLMLMENATAESPFDPASTMAPLQSQAQLDRVAGFAQDAAGRGCTVHQEPFAETTRGFFMAPALVEGCSAGMPLVDEEQFGPVLPIMPFTDDEDVLTLANAGEYGLGGSVWSADVERAIALASRLECGSAWVNQHGAYSAGLPLPFARQSGLGMDYAHFGVLEHARAMLINARV
ncbi:MULTISPECIES: aldehyde dehydrogenase family protein [unclassified Novosphingobium]|uniref:aldehyde dehydrogenase family protein n=1 Tax=unclassified Novosphingobium TaxID=2644732 RepID=UPI00135AC06D|nr:MULTISPECIES: aldehyde dehydrogenase family protein [unclassified Novosphingobium]